mmetsp:Transcript_13714/g.39121  ORF Transcript_13714/g.39121 Transcript_13714/m.39121 type:complete len:222 (+) Transcript_13714:101-766(+)
MYPNSGLDSFAFHLRQHITQYHSPRAVQPSQRRRPQWPHRFHSASRSVARGEKPAAKGDGASWKTSRTGRKPGPSSSGLSLSATAAASYGRIFRSPGSILRSHHWRICQLLNGPRRMSRWSRYSQQPQLPAFAASTANMEPSSPASAARATAERQSHTRMGLNMRALSRPMPFHSEMLMERPLVRVRNFFRCRRTSFFSVITWIAVQHWLGYCARAARWRQ